MMNDLLQDINLQTVPDNYLVGDWQVASRVLSRHSPDCPLTQATRLVLSFDATLLAHAGTDAAASATGRWAVQRDELLNRPYLRFVLPTDEARALVTRLRRSPDGQQALLNLYFASGMELQLNLRGPFVVPVHDLA